MKRIIAATIVLAVALAILLPSIAFAGGGQVQYGRPGGDMPYAGDGDRTGGDWGNPDNNG
jgi:hypothetical protein